jgi:hypothetical protein
MLTTQSSVWRNEIFVKPNWNLQQHIKLYHNPLQSVINHFFGLDFELSYSFNCSDDEDDSYASTEESESSEDEDTPEPTPKKTKSDGQEINHTLKAPSNKSPICSEGHVVLWIIKISQSIRTKRLLYYIALHVRNRESFDFPKVLTFATKK